YKDEMASDRFKALSPDEQQELCDKARESLRAGLERLAGMIKRRDVALWAGHTLNPDNRMYRRLFERLTGEKLPAGAKATQEFVADFVGRAAIDGYVQAKQKAAEAKEAERAASVRKELDAIVARIKAGEEVSGSDLV